MRKNTGTELGGCSEVVEIHSQVLDVFWRQSHRFCQQIRCGLRRRVMDDFDISNWEDGVAVNQVGEDMQKTHVYGKRSGVWLCIR